MVPGPGPSAAVGFECDRVRPITVNGYWVEVLDDLPGKQPAFVIDDWAWYLCILCVWYSRPALRAYAFALLAKVWVGQRVVCLP